MQPRRSLALVAGALLLCLPVLGACGFDQATNRVYTQANGLNYREGDVYVLNAVIAAGQPNSGTLIASLANRSETQTATLTSVAGGDGNSVTGGDFAPIKIPPMGFVNLADAGPVSISGSFGAGSILPISLDFSDGKTITMSVTVVYACQQYAGLDTSQSSSTPSLSTSASPGDQTSPSTSPSTSPGVSPAGSVSPLTSAVPSSSESTGSASSSPSEAEPTATPSETSSTSGESSVTASTGDSTGASSSASAYTCGTTGGTGGSN